MDGLHAVVKQLAQVAQVLLARGTDEHALATIEARHPGLLQFFQGELVLALGCQIMRIVRGRAIRIDLVEDGDHRFVARTDLRQRCFHRGVLCFKIVMADVHDVQQ